TCILPTFPSPRVRAGSIYWQTCTHCTGSHFSCAPIVTSPGWPTFIGRGEWQPGGLAVDARRVAARWPRDGDTMTAVDEAGLAVQVALGRRYVECATCGEITTGDDVVFGDEWVCRSCDAERWNAVFDMAALIGIAMTCQDVHAVKKIV